MFGFPFSCYSLVLSQCDLPCNEGIPRALLPEGCRFGFRFGPGGKELYAAKRLCVGLGLGKANDFLVGLELPAFLEQLYALEALQYVAFSGDRAGSLKAAML